MVKIGLMSDTHGYINPKVFDHFKEVDEIWHAGDIGSLEVIDELRKFKPTRFVYGNIDNAEIQKECPENNLFEVEDLKVLMTHIAGRPGRYPARVNKLIRENKPDIFVCGHSHILLVQKANSDLLHLNPGAAGKHGFHSVSTLLRFNLAEGKISNMEVIELEKRK